MSEMTVVVRKPQSDEDVLAAALRDGIISGTVLAAAERTWMRIREVEAENKRLRHRNIVLAERNKLLEEDRLELRLGNRRAREAAYGRNLAFEKSRSWRVATGIGLLGIGGVVTALATVLVVLR